MCELGYTGRLCDEDIGKLGDMFVKTFLFQNGIFNLVVYVDECGISSPCRNGATCVNTNGSYVCECAIGYEGRDCITNTDDCADNPCLNGKFLLISMHS